jgi:hypothetical protein
LQFVKIRRLQEMPVEACRVSRFAIHSVSLIRLAQVALIDATVCWTLCTRFRWIQGRGYFAPDEQLIEVSTMIDEFTTYQNGR